MILENIPIRHIATQNEPQLSAVYAVRDIRSLLLEDDMVQELHRHDFFYILVIKKGAGLHSIDFTDYEITDNTIFIMRPGQVHYLHLKAKSTGYLVQFKTDFLYSHNTTSQNHLTRLIQNCTYNLEPGGFRKIETILKEALTEYTDKAKGYQEVLKANLSIFLIELLRQRQGIPLQSKPSTSYAQGKLEQFLELLETKITSNKQVSAYANLLHLSPYQLSAITKSLLNKTPSEIINGHIILEAKRQLLATSNQVSQIAYNLGYDDASYFTRFFKKHTAMSPELFRQNSK